MLELTTNGTPNYTKMHSVFTELSLIIALGAFIAFCMRLIHQPLIIGHIITGILVGPSFLHLVQSSETIETFSSIGIALLLFIIGLGLNPGVIKEVGKVAGTVGVLQVAITMLAGYTVGKLLGLGDTESLFAGVATAFSSTIIILKLLSDKKQQGRLYGKIVIGILIIQDIVAATALLLLAAQGDGTGFSVTQLASLVGKGILVAIPLFLIGGKILPKMHNLIAGSQEFLFLFAIGWGFGSSALFELAGFSLEMGALVAGVSLASLPYSQEISARLRPLRDFFIVVFFIALGTQLRFDNIYNYLGDIFAFLVVVILIKPFVVLTIMGLMGYTKQTSFKASTALAQTSEFSLVFITLAYKQGQVSAELVTTLTLVTLLSIAYSTYVIMYSEQLFGYFQRHLGLFERRKTQYEQQITKHHYDLVLFGYHKGGHEFLRVFKSLKKRYIVIDYDPEIIDLLEHQKIEYLYGDATDIELLHEAGIEKSKLLVSTISDHDTNIFLVKLMERINPHSVVICHADNVAQAAQLYELGASYVMMPHYIGSEKIGTFIKNSGLKKSEFKKFREKHLDYLTEHFSDGTE